MSFDYWFETVDRSFAFLLVLPFLVGLAGLVSEYLRQLWVAPREMLKNSASRRDIEAHIPQMSSDFGGNLRYLSSLAGLGATRRANRWFFRSRA